MSIKHRLIHNEKLNARKLKLISFISLLMGFSQATFIYVMSYYFKEASGTENLGVFYLVSYSILLVLILNYHKFVKKLGKSRVFFFSFLMEIISISLLATINLSWVGVAVLMLYIISNNLNWLGLDVILESFSTDKMSGRIRGLYLTIMNAGFIFGPFVSVSLFDNFNFRGIFIFLLIMESIIFMIALVKLRDVNHCFKRTESVRELIKKVMKRKDVLRSYYLSFVLYFFYALIVIYTPLYLLDIGVTLKSIGIIFTIMLIPFVLLQYPVGLIADKKMGEKELLILSLIIMGAATTSIYFIEGTSIVIWAVVLFATRIGAAMLELLSDSYFYKKVDSEDVDIIDFFRTSRAVAFIVASILTAIMLLFFPIKSIFLLIAAVVFSGLYPAFRLKDNAGVK